MKIPIGDRDHGDGVLVVRRGGVNKPGLAQKMTMGNGRNHTHIVRDILSPME